MEMEFDFILRIFVAALLGGAIGLEREYRAKEAGFRTHFLVALGSALFMIVSAYGFEDVVMLPGHRLDVSRVAAQVVSGIGFIGAGTIIFHKSENVVRGLDYCCWCLGCCSHRSCLRRWYVQTCHRLYAPRARRPRSLQFFSPQVRQAQEK